MLHYLGVPIKGRAYMFKDNELVIYSSTLPHSHLTKRHNALSYHSMCKAIVMKILNFSYIQRENNPADILSNHCGFPQLWPHFQLLLFSFSCPDPCNDEVKEIEEERIEIWTSWYQLPVSTCMTQRVVTGSKQDWDQWYMMRLAGSWMAGLSKEECGTCLNIWIDHVYGSMAVCVEGASIFSDDIMIWMSCSLSGSKCLYIWLIGSFWGTEFMFLCKVQYSQYDGWPDHWGSNSHNCVESCTDQWDGASY